ncbi:MAG: peptidylprolyl isomerase [Bacteroidota bacterium]|nr:peptidylprolyl isomerase [Bacteroidota bacterium]
MRRILSLLIIIQFSFQLSAQKKVKDTVLFTYGPNQVSVQEFRKGFTKNEKQGVKHKPEEVDDYLNLYKKFKLKVQDAYDNGLSNTEDFKTELASYRKQIAKPYLTDRVVNEQLINEAYVRMQNEVNASHILIFISNDALPADTLIAFNKIKAIRTEILSGKINFDNAAVQYSEDPTAKDNKGSLGYFSAFQMIYEFENAAFNTPVGEISAPVRTQFGYHLVKVNDKRPSKGELTVRHIMIQTNPKPGLEELEEAQAKINEVYKKLQLGEKFEQLVQQYSEDANTVIKNGEMAPFTMTNSRLPENFKKIAFDLLNDGDYSRPIQTQGGFHIIKRVSLKPMPSLEDSKSAILSKINRDSRQYKNTLAVYKKASNYYKVKENKKASNTLYALIDSSILNGTYVHPENATSGKQKKLYNTVLFTLQKVKKSYTVSDFSKWLVEVQKPSNSKSVKGAIDNYFNAYRMNTVMDYYEEDLENINDTFANLYKEYKEGILLFSLTDKNVWTKSVEDSTGLKDFYNKNASKYQFKDRYDATIFKCANKAVADAIKKDLEAGITIDSILRKQNKLNPLNVASPKTGKFEKGDDFYANNIFEANQNDIKYLTFEDPKTPGSYIVIQVHQFIPQGQKNLSEARGLIISDYQNYLENLWIESLMIKYPIKVDESVYNTLKSSLTR